MVNPEGGSASALTLLLARVWALSGQPTLLIDFGDGACTRAWRQPPLAEGALLRAFEEGAGSLGLLLRSAEIGLDLLPQDPGPGNLSASDRERLRAALSELRRPYAHVIFDLGPGTGPLAAIAEGLADAVLCPRGARVATGPADRREAPLSEAQARRIFEELTPAESLRLPSMDEMLDRAELRNIVQLAKELSRGGT